MIPCLIKDIYTTTDRHKLYTLGRSLHELSARISFIQDENVSVINIGNELAMYIDALDNYRHLNIDVYNFTKKLLDNKKAKINMNGNDIVIIYDLNFLIEFVSVYE